MKVASIVGTRPEMIKMWGVLKRLDDLPIEHSFIHTGQNYTKELKDFFFRDLKLRDPDFYLDVTTDSVGAEIADIIAKCDGLFEKIQPDALVILGDTFSGLSIIPAVHRGIKTFHMEAGLRAYDKRMPEQKNRILIDHTADINFPYYDYHRENLLRENLPPSKVIKTGNPVFETLRNFANEINESDILSRLNLKENGYFSVTIHRKENVDDPIELENILTGLSEIGNQFSKEVICLLHPRTTERLNAQNIPSNVRTLKPLGFYDFNCLNKHAFCLLGDSGSTPEEGLFFGRPCVSIRKSTERFETLEAGSHIISGTSPEKIVRAVEIVTKMELRPRYDFCENFSPSNVVINTMMSSIENFI